MQTVSQLLRVKGGQIFSVAPTDSVLHAIEMMADRHVGALLVMSHGLPARHHFGARLRPKGHPEESLLARYAGERDHDLAGGDGGASRTRCIIACSS